EKHREHREHRRNRKADAPEAHEIELGIVGNDAKQAHGNVLQIGTVLGRTQRTQVATTSRVKVKAVNSVVMMPMPSVTAKPRTGPVPMKSRTAAAMNVVMVESRMVASARLKPASIAAMAERPWRTSSRMRS